jgi:hypothetical protein
MKETHPSLALAQWLFIFVGLIGAFVLLRGVRIATSEQRDENGKRISLNLMVVVGIGNTINLNDARINYHEEPRT